MTEKTEAEQRRQGMHGFALIVALLWAVVGLGVKYFGFNPNLSLALILEPLLWVVILIAAGTWLRQTVKEAVADAVVSAFLIGAAASEVNANAQKGALRN